MAKDNKIKQYLEKVKHQDTIIQNLKKQVNDLRGTLYSISSLGAGDKVQTSAKSESRFAETLEKIDAKETQISKELANMIDFKMNVCEEINKLSDSRFVAVLYARYIEFKTWEVIAEELCYNMRYLFNIHGQALKEFETIHTDSLNN